MSGTPSEVPASDAVQTQRRRHWRRTRRLTVVLLLLWMSVTFVVAHFARDLDFAFLGWPFSFWMAAQGAPLIYLALVVTYAVRMNRLDQIHDVDEQS